MSAAEVLDCEISIECATESRERRCNKMSVDDLCQFILDWPVENKSLCGCRSFIIGDSDHLTIKYDDLADEKKTMVMKIFPTKRSRAQCEEALMMMKRCIPAKHSTKEFDDPSLDDLPALVAASSLVSMYGGSFDQVYEQFAKDVRIMNEEELEKIYTLLNAAYDQRRRTRALIFKVGNVVDVVDVNEYIVTGVVSKVNRTTIAVEFAIPVILWGKKYDKIWKCEPISLTLSSSK